VGRYYRRRGKINKFWLDTKFWIVFVVACIVVFLLLSPQVADGIKGTISQIVTNNPTNEPDKIEYYDIGYALKKINNNRSDNGFTVISANNEMNDIAKDLSVKVYDEVLTKSCRLKNIMSEKYRCSMFSIPQFYTYINESKLKEEELIAIIRAKTSISPSVLELEHIKADMSKISDSLVNSLTDKEIVDLWINNNKADYRLNYPSLSQVGLAVSKYKNAMVCLMVVKTNEIGSTDLRYWELIGLQ